MFYMIYSWILGPLPEGEPISIVISEISYGLIYLTVFIVPALIYRFLSKNTRIRPLDLFKPMNRASLKYVFLTITIGFTCSYITSILFSLLGITEMIMPSQTAPEPMAFYQFLLAVFTTAIVPAICEEFLFRSTILSNLLPYGQGFAIITSAVLFGLMHQNIIQIFYTTMAGILLGYAYVKTKSYLCVFLIHFCNNFINIESILFIYRIGCPKYAKVRSVT